MITCEPAFAVEHAEEPGVSDHDPAKAHDADAVEAGDVVLVVIGVEDAASVAVGREARHQRFQPLLPP